MSIIAYLNKLRQMSDERHSSVKSTLTGWLMNDLNLECSARKLSRTF